MKRYRSLPLAAVLLALAGAAAAQLVNPFARDAVPLAAEDSAKLWAAVHGVLADYRPGAESAWSNPATRRAGVARVLRTFSRDGSRCADVQHAFTQGGGAAYTFPFCQVQDGSWKIAP